MDEEKRWILKIQKKRSRDAADLLVRKYYQEIYVYVFRQLSNKDDAMDLTQDIFIATLQTIHSYDPSRSTFRTWLYRIATNKIIDVHRKYKPEMFPVEETDIVDPHDWLSELHNTSILQEIERFVSQFDDRTQTIFRLHIYDEQSFRTIGSALSLPEATVKTKYYRLQKKIREEFKDYDI